MSNFASSLRLPRETTSHYPLLVERNGGRYLGIDPVSNASVHRHFVLQPISPERSSAMKRCTVPGGRMNSMEIQMRPRAS